VIRLVVVDDHAAAWLSYSACLGEADGVEVVGAAANGREAVELCRTNGPDVCLMDVRMPVMDGIEATRQIKADRPATRVVLVSAYEEPELVEAGLQAGADLFVVKGVSGAELVSHVKEVTTR
jgi:DNA-binding NarL/FixJ family response regulator